MEIIEMDNTKLPHELEFHEDIRLLIYRPRGLVNEAALNNTLGALEDLEAKLQEPFNRFTDTLAADEVSDSRYRFHDDSLRKDARRTNSRFSHQSPCFPRPERSCGLVERACRT